MSTIRIFAHLRNAASAWGETNEELCRRTALDACTAVYRHFWVRTGIFSMRSKNRTIGNRCIENFLIYKIPEQITLIFFDSALIEDRIFMTCFSMQNSYLAHLT